jgi:peptidoglycan hydrolase-like protein with peptidoglycan-binding domain
MDCKNILLKKGSTGPLVNELEHYLHPLGLYPYKYDEDFGKGVEAGVTARQAQLKLKTDGIFGPVSCVTFGLNDKPTSTVDYRPVVICSDNINGIAVDKKRIQDICDILTSKGLKCSYFGIGPNTHISVLTASSTPKNAVVVDIVGGADSAMIKEMGSTYYQNIKGDKIVFTVYTNIHKVNGKDVPTNITGLSWLPRAHDDNYSPKSFTGISRPDLFMENLGYNYIWTNDLNQIAAAIIKEAVI